MADGNGIIGIIAGGGQFPLMIAEAARSKGIKVVAVAHHGETDPNLSRGVDEIFWVKLGQLGKIIKFLQMSGVKKTLMAGTINKGRMFENIKPDLKGLAIMSKLAIFHDDDILRAVAQELAKAGIEIIPSTEFLPELLTPPGNLTRRKPSRTEKEDIRFGWKIAKELGRLDIGQCVVVRRKTALALEAIDGTNETILRGGRLAKEKAVVVKVSKPNQDLRFDLPSVGLDTIEVMSRVRASVLALEAGRTLFFNRDDAIDLADKVGISIVSLEKAD
ncbi:MAG: UDP-2,3-diacylglucosamine diphosphatase LpxI [Deltaproteobacteria bacterium]|nr:UDP-2,3-diacylglucosamine diphosphatase LpxI [Deltaproteobacteria bacterium]